MALRRTVQPSPVDRDSLSTRSAHDAVVRQLQRAAALPEATVSGTIPAASSLVLVHRLGRVPKSWAVEKCDLGGPITCTARDSTSITLANAHATDAAAVTVRVY